MPTPASTQFTETRVSVEADWVDYNGHMNLAYYVLAFDKATDTFYDNLGIGLAYREQMNSSMFTLGINVDYLQEVFVGDELRITTQLLDCDAKRLRYFHQMYQGASQDTSQGTLEKPVATNECLAVHVDMGLRKSAPFPELTRTRIDTALAEHRQLPQPERAGRVLGFSAK
ncbi:MAG: thioesterase family protein [Porticoccaceae bacterium]|nr:thioesterase family protein [Porticoccaceae bacterium]